MNSISLVLTTIIETPGIPLRIGFLIATAMIVGYMLYDNSPGTYFRVVLSFVVFLLMVEWIRNTIIIYAATPSHPNTLVTAISLVSGVAFLSGLSAGMFMARSYRKKYDKMEEAAHDVMKQIRSREIKPIDKSLNQKTNPLNKH